MASKNGVTLVLLDCEEENVVIKNNSKAIRS